MFVVPAGWVRHHAAHQLTLYVPGGGGRIRCHERIAPLRRMSETIQYIVDRDPAFALHGIHDVEHLATAEGEHAMWARLGGSREGAPVTRYVAAVFGDDFTDAVDALVVAPERRPVFEAAARELVIGASLGLGVRRRRFLYDAPPGWRAMPFGLVAHWYGPAFPRDPTTIAVSPAEPSNAPLEVLLASVLAGDRDRAYAIDDEIETAAIASASGLAGQRWDYVARIDGEVTHRTLAAFAAGPYVYALRMESSRRDGPHRAVFDAIVRSVVAVPAVSHARRAVPELFGHLV